MSDEEKITQSEDKKQNSFLKRLHKKKKKKKKRRLDTDPIHLACLGAAILLISGLVVISLISSGEKIESQVFEVESAFYDETGSNFEDVWGMIKNEEFDKLNDIFFEEE